MTDAEQREAAHQFVNKWKDKAGKEDEEGRSYWLDLLEKVFGVSDATDRIDFEKKVVVDGQTKRIDAYIPETHVLIEQKSKGKALDEKIYAIEDELRRVKDQLEHLTAYTIDWFKGLKKKYGKDYPRQTEISSFETIAATKVVNLSAKLYANLEAGFVGIGLKKDDNGTFISDCSDLSEIIVIGRDGRYRVTKVSDKAFFGEDLLYVGVFNRNDTRTIYNVIYRDGKSSVYFAKRFAITSVTRDKEYDITSGKADSKILWFTVNHNGEAESVRVYLRPKAKLKKTQLEYDFSTLAIKGRASRGNLVTKNPVHKIVIKSKGVSTIGGKDVWYDGDIQRLNEDGRGIHLGQFTGEDRILAVFADGSFYTTGIDLSNRYQGEVLRIEKFDPERTFTALYWDGGAKAFYVKRFSFVESNNTPLSFIADGKGSYLVALSDEPYPQVVVTFGGKYAHREAETLDAEAFIAKKGYAAKGKKCHAYELKSVAFGEPLHKAEANEQPDEEALPDAPEEMPEAPAADEPQGAVDLSDLEPTLF